MKKVLITCESSSWKDAKVIDCETGLVIPNIQCVEAKIEVAKTNTAKIKMLGVASEIQVYAEFDIKCPHCQKMYKSPIPDNELKMLRII